LNKPEYERKSAGVEWGGGSSFASNGNAIFSARSERPTEQKKKKKSRGGGSGLKEESHAGLREESHYEFAGCI
jgi:hypothetical protein